MCPRRSRSFGLRKLWPSRVDGDSHPGRVNRSMVGYSDGVPDPFQCHGPTVRTNPWLVIQSCGWVAGLILSVGCGPGAVRLEDIDGFGRARSAVWIEWRQRRDGVRRVRHEYVLADRGGLCAELQEVVPALSGRYDDMVAEMGADPGNANALCDATAGFHEDATGLTESLYDRPLDVFSATLRDPNAALADAPPDGAYEAGQHPDSPWFHGALVRQQTNPFAVFAREVGDCESGWERVAVDIVADQTTRYDIDDGQASLSGRNDETVLLELSGRLRDDGGKSAGEIDAHGRFSHCVVSWDSWYEPDLWGP